MSVKSLRAALARAKRTFERKADSESSENEKVDVNDAMMSFAAWVGAGQGEVKKHSAGVDPKLVKELIGHLEEFYGETQDEKNWEDDGRWPYPTHADELYGSMAEEIGLLIGAIDRHESANWEDDGSWPYPTHSDELYGSMAEEIGLLIGAIDRHESAKRARRE